MNEKAKAEKEKQAELDKKKHDEIKAEEERIAKLQAKIRVEAARKRSEELNKDIEDEKALTLKKTEGLLKIQTDYAAWLKDNNDKEKANEKEYREAIKNVAYDSTLSLLSSLQSLNETFSGQTEEEQKKAFKRSKALAIADTVISTYAGAQKAFTSLAGVGPVGPVLGAIAAAAAIAAGLAKIAAIKKTTFQGTGGGGGGGMTTTSGGTNTPRAATTGFSKVNTPAQTGGTIDVNKQATPLKVYVLEKDITNRQKTQNSIISKAVIK
jgi:hypothetical protein